MKQEVKDHGYAWVILGAAFCLQFIVGSLFMAFSVLLVEFPEVFQTDKATSSWIGSILIGASSISGNNSVYIQ